MPLTPLTDAVPAERALRSLLAGDDRPWRWKLRRTTALGVSVTSNCRVVRPFHDAARTCSMGVARSSPWWLDGHRSDRLQLRRWPPGASHLGELGALTPYVGSNGRSRSRIGRLRGRRRKPWPTRVGRLHDGMAQWEYYAAVVLGVHNERLDQPSVPAWNGQAHGPTPAAATVNLCGSAGRPTPRASPPALCTPNAPSTTSSVHHPEVPPTATSPSPTGNTNTSTGSGNNPPSRCTTRARRSSGFGTCGGTAPRRSCTWTRHGGHGRKG